MTSISRKLRRANARKNGADWTPKEQPFRVHQDKSYDVLHPTKGWRHVSWKRARFYA